MKKDRFIRVPIYFFCSIFLFMGCASTTNIKSRPDGAEVFIDNVRIGVTPVQYSDTAIAGSTKALRLKKEGYRPFDSVIRKSEFQVGPCIGGVFVLFPFIWVLGYPEVYELELEKLPEPEKKSQTERPVDELAGLSGLF
ncbi:MAG: PEGA domain-containing protein [Thermodesulfobacteriota bacterium]|jgi:hypothetical protein